MNEPLVYIVILNYNGYRDTIECVKSIEDITYKNYKIVIVDNASTDDSEKMLNKSFSKHHIIQTGKNLGFAGGNNIGIKYAIQNNAEYILLLNNDTIVDKDFLGYLVKGFSLHENVGMVGAKIYYYDMPNKVWYAGGKFNRLRAKGEHCVIDIDTNYKEVEFITGCLQLISVNALKKVGLMEEKYFLYYEDVDYCFRFMDNGYKLIYSKESKIYHKCGGSANYKSPLSIFYSNRNRYIFINTYLNGLSKILAKTNYFIELLVKFIIYRGENRHAIKKVIKYILT